MRQIIDAVEVFLCETRKHLMIETYANDVPMTLDVVELDREVDEGLLDHPFIQSAAIAALSQAYGPRWHQQFRRWLERR